MDKESELFFQISKISNSISSALNTDRTTIFVYNGDKVILECLFALGLEDYKVLTIPIGRGIAGKVANSKKAYISNNTADDKLFDPYYDNLTGYSTEKVICVPILNDQDQCLGVIQSLNKKEGTFTQQDLSVLQGFSSTATVLIESTKLYSITTQMKKSVDTLLNVSSIINSELELEKVIELIILKSSEITKSDRSTFFLYDNHANELITYFGQGLDNIKIRTNKGIVGWIAKNKLPLIENKPYSNPFFDKSIDQTTNYKTESILGVPVLNTNNELIGVVEVLNKIGGDYSDQDLQILEGFASHISIAIQNAKLFGEVYSMKNYFTLLFENLDNGIITFDKNGYVKTINSKFCDILGLDKNRFIDKHYSIFQNEYNPIYSHTKYLFQSGKKQKVTGLKIVKEDNKKSIYNLSSLPMNDSGGQNVGAINVIQDITKETRVQQNLSRYLPSHIVSEVFNRDDLSLLDGKYKRCSILFSDLRNFTSITEKMGAIEVVKFLNTYFNTMVDSVLLNNGILDKFIGDAIMAVFGIPYAGQNDAKNSIDCALDMLDKLEVLNSSKLQSKKISLGIGIATGNVISGNIGSNERFEYTVIGDAVNLASRLENVTKDYGLNLLIDSATQKKVAAYYHFREIGTIKVKGKERTTNIYHVLGKKETLLCNKQSDFVYNYESGLYHYRRKEYDIANNFYSKALALYPNDIATKRQIKNLECVKL
jgi:adenylate cyclase